MSFTNVLITGNATIARAALLKLVQASTYFPVVRESSTDEALGGVESLAPEVVLLHADPERPEFDMIRQMRQQWPTGGVVVLARRRDKAYVRAVLAAGAHAYVLLQGDPASLIAALRAAAQGRRYLDPELSEEMVDVLVGKESDPHVQLLDELLSAREQQVLRLLALGHTQQKIGDQIGVSAKTVETYRWRIAKKLDLHTRAEIVRFALAVGLLSSPSAN